MKAVGRPEDGLDAAVYPDRGSEGIEVPPGGARHCGVVSLVARERPARPPSPPEPPKPDADRGRLGRQP